MRQPLARRHRQPRLAFDTIVLLGVDEAGPRQAQVAPHASRKWHAAPDAIALLDNDSGDEMDGAVTG